MLDGKRVGAIIPAGGKGVRMGASSAKQFLALGGKPIFLHTLERVHSCPEVDRIVLVAPREHASQMEESVRSGHLAKTSVAIGGDQRQDSVWSGLQLLKSDEIDIVVVHDAVRPFISHELIREVVATALNHGAAIAAVRPKDTVKSSSDDRVVLTTLKRDRLWIVQTPQAFRFDLLFQAYEKAFADGFYGTDDASLVERMGIDVKIVPGNYDNIKITTTEDLEFGNLIARRLG